MITFVHYQTAEVTDDLDGEHQRNQPGNGTEKVLDVAEAVVLVAQDVGSHPDDQGASQGDVEVRRGREEARHQPHQVGDQDIEGEGGQHREHHPRSLASHVLGHELLEAADDHLPEVLALVGDQAQVTQGELGDDHQEEHDQPGVGHVG